MKVSFAGGKKLTAGTYQLTRQDIEQQALSDLAKYVRLFQERQGGSVTYPLDVDHMAKELWGASVSYRGIPQSVDEEVLGYYDHSKKEIVVDPEVCSSDGRTTFTVAHELGHISLHSCIMAFPQQGAKQKKSDKTWRLEWQATRYAVSLLAPRTRVYDKLRELGLVQLGVAQTVDLAVHAAVLQDAFGLSRQALEIRLEEMNISTLHRRYD